MTTGPARLTWYSLPLMGIRNDPAGARGGYCARSSLPLMGIRNNGVSVSASMIVFSLPLMGIRNLLPVFICGVSPSSLPLMGIRNNPPSTRRSRAASSHYPSWGSGTACASASRSLPSCSLPLMGIRNPFIFRHFSLLMGSGSVQHASADRQTCAWTPSQRWFSAQAHGIPSENGPVFPVPFVFFLAHLSAELIFSESAYFDVVPIFGNEL